MNPFRRNPERDLWSRWLDTVASPKCEPAPPDYPRFCSRCGSALAYRSDPIGFDEKTGAPRFHRWAHCPTWTGLPYKVVTPQHWETADYLNETFTARLYPYSAGLYAKFYLDCRPEYVDPNRPIDAAARLRDLGFPDYDYLP